MLGIILFPSTGEIVYYYMQMYTLSWNEREVIKATKQFFRIVWLEGRFYINAVFDRRQLESKKYTPQFIYDNVCVIVRHCLHGCTCVCLVVFI